MRSGKLTPSPCGQVQRDWSAAALVELAWHLAEHGPTPYEEELADLARVALACGAAPSSAAVLADPCQPSVARERAYGRVAEALVRYGPNSRAQAPAA